ncbi:MAG: cytochrome c [Pirellulaceae bacterium]|nr:MAG: cytochrome c [Pirellulaceae bacterium]
MGLATVSMQTLCFFYHRSGFLGFAAAGLILMAGGGQNAFAQAKALAPEDEAFFERHIRPILVEHCYGCHSARAEKIQGGLRLDSRQGMLRGGESGPVIVPGRVEESLLIEAVRYESLQMPPSGKLPDEKIRLLEEWVARGAPDPRDFADGPSRDQVTAEMGRLHWAFQPPVLPAPPPVQRPEWPRGPLDRYLLARLEQAGLEPQPEADRRTLIRRLYFDLLGLPPTYDEVQQFVEDPSADAYEKLVDRLLASPAFGERWARHWLDVARYADTKGYVFQEDRSYPQAYQYRDWVIQTLNRDLPYADFLKYQIAADLLPPLEGLSVPATAAMGYFTLGRRFLNNKHDVIDDRIDVLTRGMLGLTVTCARCHDHKYDPVTMQDYYALYGVFDSSLEPLKDHAQLEMVENPQPRNARVLLRGQPGNPGPEVARRFIEVLCRGQPEPFRQGSGRRELAEAVASPDNPLTARVIANRIWLHLFGEGLVATPSDFGLRCDPPQQPEVLDYLAVQLIEHDWSLKSLIRQIVLSAAYRQSSGVTEPARRLDPQNRLFGRQNRRRLDFEAMRDALLAVSDQLEPIIGGPSVPITQPPFPRRRTVYAYIDRQNLPGLFRVFDFAGPDTHNPKRLETITPQQALFLMNHPFVIEVAERLTENLSRHHSPPDDQWIVRAYQKLLARNPTSEELRLARDFLEHPSGTAAQLAPTVWEYGYGRYEDQEGNRVTFQPLPHFTGSAWQGGPDLPDPKLGWVMLTAEGGHPGDSDHVAIRRWKAPRSGRVQIRGLLVHASEQGDGVRARLVSSSRGKLGEWVVQNSQQPTRLDNVEVQAGQVLDFAVDCRDSISYDSFRWTIRIAYEEPLDEPRAFRSQEQFTGPQPAPLSRPAQLVQVLLLSNEFHFVD